MFLCNTATEAGRQQFCCRTQKFTFETGLMLLSLPPTRANWPCIVCKMPCHYQQSCLCAS